MLVEKSSWNCASPALRFDWFNADDAVERTANGIEIGYGRGQQREQERGMVHEEREREQRGGLPSEASTFRSALHVVKYGCGQFSNNNNNSNNR